MGEWTFHLSTPGPTRTSCGHQRPDVPEKQPKVELADTSELKVRFTDPDGAFVDGQRGYFSMVYDEGFEFAAGDRDFFAFSNFDLHTVDGKAVNMSHCGKTEVGWYSNKARTEFGCFYGEKVHQVPAKVLVQAATPAAPKKLLKADHARIVSLINEKATTWKAKAYDQYVGKTTLEMNKRAGLMRKPQPEKKLSFLSTSRALRRSKSIEASLPKSFDWRDVNGTSYLEPVMDQGDCGSCYVVAAMRMLSARHRIKTGDTVPFSISFPLYCSEYNQGCQGGYSTLVARWSQDVGLVPATCATYTTQGKCNYECMAQGTKYRADNPRYVGGYYGAANVGNMMTELMTNGPFAIGLRPKNDFMYYTEGVYQSGAMPTIDHDLASGGEWQRVDHAVLLVGWGEENGVKYWTLQNSWDNYWGEDGFMRIKRGDNDSGIESIPEAADVVKDETNGARVANFISQLKL